jgi:shikimate kinase
VKREANRNPWRRLGDAVIRTETTAFPKRNAVLYYLMINPKHLRNRLKSGRSNRPIH